MKNFTVSGTTHTGCVYSSADCGTGFAPRLIGGNNWCDNCATTGCTNCFWHNNADKKCNSCDGGSNKFLKDNLCVDAN